MRRVVCHSTEFGLCLFARGADPVEAQFRTNRHNGLVADHHPIGELPFHASHILLLHTALLKLFSHRLGTLGMLPNKHDPRRKPIQTVTRPGHEVRTAQSAQNLNNRIVVVSPCGMDRHTSRLVDDEHIIIFMDNSNVMSGHGRFMTMQRMRNNLAIFDHCVWAGDLAVHRDRPFLEG